MKNYYFILSLNITATEGEIKASYRKLALQFHPDKNPSPEAEAIFKEVNEAYEVLGDPVRKFLYDQMLKGEEAPPPEPVKTHRDPRYRPRPVPNAARRPTHREEILSMMAAHLKYAMMISRFTLVFSVVLIADYSLPAVKTVSEVVTVLDVHQRGRRYSNDKYEFELKDGGSVTVSAAAGRNLISATKVGVYRSAWFAIPLTVENESTHFRAPVYVSIYGTFIFWPILLLLTSLAGTFYWKGVEFRFNVGIVNLILFLLTLVFLQVHKF